VRRSRRIDYDAIAHLYDAQPHRQKLIDPELLSFVGRHASNRLSILDIGCGTGNQLLANRAIAPSAQLVGLDRSLGMLRQAQAKARDIDWLQADSAALPFRAESFDFACCQFAFHHLYNKEATLAEVFRALKRGGRLVIHNLCPQECSDWLYYEYFPEAHAIDLKDFWPSATVVAAMKSRGFTAVTVEHNHLHFEQDMLAWLRTVQRRDTNSQLLTISDSAYDAGIRRLEHELTDDGAAQTRPDHLCLVTIRGDKEIGRAG
jgi:ubiquinone/menaquinone biosynthesis C-methylase UbiE